MGRRRWALLLGRPFSGSGCIPTARVPFAVCLLSPLVVSCRMFSHPIVYVFPTIATNT